MLVLQLMQITISTHALREEGDPVPIHWLYNSQYFYPRPPRGGRLCPAFTHMFAIQFLPTPSARRATSARGCNGAEALGNFYPRPPRGGRQDGNNKSRGIDYISTHALREEGDHLQCDALQMLKLFLPTPSARRATFMVDKGKEAYQFLPTPSARRATQNQAAENAVK